MPYYIFEHISTGKTEEVFFHMNDDKVYNGKNGKQKGKWRRVFINPQASIDTSIDPYSETQFINKTGGKNYTKGDGWDLSAELSAKRAAKEGSDPVKDKFYKEQRELRGGKASGAEIKDHIENFTLEI